MAPESVPENFPGPEFLAGGHRAQPHRRLVKFGIAAGLGRRGSNPASLVYSGSWAGKKLPPLQETGGEAEAATVMRWSVVIRDLLQGLIGILIPTIPKYQH